MNASQKRTSKTLAAVSIGAIGIFGLAGNAGATASPRTAAVWHRTRIVTTGSSDLSGPYLANSPAGTMLAGYVNSDKHGKYSLGWRTLGAHGWTKSIVAASGIAPGRAFPPAIAASNQRVATVAIALKAGSGAAIANLNVQTYTGRRLAHLTFPAGRASVAIDGANNVTVVGSNYLSNGTTTITAWRVSPAGKLTQKVVLQRSPKSLGAPAVVTIGTGTFMAAWLQQAGRVGTNDNYVQTDTVRTARFANGAWQKAGARTPGDTSIIYLGLKARGSQALLTYARFENRNNSESALDLHAIRYRAGTWQHDTLVAKKTGLGVASISANYTAEITTDRTYSQPSGATSWHVGTKTPALPKEFCGGNTFATGYQGNLLHWFVSAYTHNSCTMIDYTKH